MALFKRKKKAVKPTAKERKTITARLQKKYPQMYTPVGFSKREQKAFEGLSPADKKALMKMTGRKMKKIYRKK